MAKKKKEEPKEKKEKKGKVEYRKAKNGRVYKLVGGKPRFVSKVEAKKAGF